ncbi:MAG: DoxX family membrane protein [Gemmatimonadota bacterium]|nr:DoxX family membrane protein [Gemmatimonadota bacterium]MDH3366476.1 DoxX family membrane protein [Gemmatimonadota bacterium]MDH3479085.1 DoxX family membrane protein [Gemmatimonadota bacterium]MDH3571524.1 DoxX family membrane protein [Gemmatimonadota bacterium]MDH5549601.1 DoxX family membrane protein [Gemmatimonadota bacterium]
MTVLTRLEPLDIRITMWMARHGVTLTRLALGVIFLWFGAIKLVPGWSPAADLAARTIERLTFGVVQPGVGLALLAVWESLIGIGLLSGRLLRLTLLLLFLQMPGTMLPLVFFPSETFVAFPYSPTLEGQYIIKNLVLVGAAIVIGATVRGGRLRAEPT